MPQIKFERIVSCSSEDPAHPATNLLLRREVNRKWKCKEAGEKTASVIIQLKEPHVITGIDIGNESSSFVEVLVSKTSTPDDFKVLLLMSSFMTPMDARGETNRNRVRMFSQKDLSDSVQREKWDRIKVVCTQPFTKHLQFGLSFLVLHTTDVKEEEKSVTQSSPKQKLGRFVLKEEDSSDIGVGSFFSRRKDLSEPPPQPPVTLTGAAAVRDASAAANLAKQKGYGKRLIDEDTQRVPKKNAENSANMGMKKVKASNGSQEEKRKERDVSKDVSSTKQKKLKKATADKANVCTPSTSTQQPIENPSFQLPNITYKPFNKLLEGVEIVISGYVNPGRADIRDKALQMGAKYKPDWCSTSTHLICAFANTPKFQQVKGKGSIVLRDWVDECHKQRKHLPWRRFAVDDADRKIKGNEPEIWELVPKAEGRNENIDEQRNNRNSLAMKDTRLISESSSDSEDEIERIKSKQALKISHLPSDSGNLKGVSKTKQKGDEYDASTDIDSEEEATKQECLWSKQKGEGRLKELPFLPNFFKGKTFNLSFDLSDSEKESLSRYVIAFGGEVATSSSRAHYVLAWKKDALSMDSKVVSDAVFISPDWVWECNDQSKLVPPGPFQLF